MLPPADNEILNSWKEIAQYLSRGERTVQRWEAEIGLPVRRPRGRGKTPVLALRGEIDSWLTRTPFGNGHAPDLAQHQRSATSDLILHSRQLRTQAAQMQSDWAETVAHLVHNCAIMQSLINEHGVSLQPSVYPCPDNTESISYERSFPSK